MGGVHGRPKNLHGANDALLQAAENGELHTVAVLVGLGASVNGAVDQWGLTALMLAAEGGHTDIVNALVCTHNADVEATDVRGWTALMYAARNGHADTVNALREHGASGPETIPGESPFYRAPLPMTRLHSLETDAIRFEHDSSSGPETIASESPPAFIGAPLRVTSLRRQPETIPGESPFYRAPLPMTRLHSLETDAIRFEHDSSSGPETIASESPPAFIGAPLRVTSLRRQPETIPGESPFYRAPLPMTRLHSLETDAIRFEHDSSSGPETIASESPPAFIGAPLRVTSLRRQPATNAGESPPAFWGGIREFGSLRLSEADDFLFGDDSVPEEQLTCTICQHHVPRVRFHPCGHTACRADARELLKRRQNCHVCRQPIIEMQPLYL